MQLTKLSKYELKQPPREMNRLCSLFCGSLILKLPTADWKKAGAAGVWCDFSWTAGRYSFCTMAEIIPKHLPGDFMHQILHVCGPGFMSVAAALKASLRIMLTELMLFHFVSNFTFAIKTWGWEFVSKVIKSWNWITVLLQKGLSWILTALHRCIWLRT